MPGKWGHNVRGPNTEHCPPCSPHLQSCHRMGCSPSVPRMTFVVTEPCKGCKNTQCVTVCPVDCFHEDTDILWIDPDECIDCGACVPECPVNAIFAANRVPEKWAHYIELNAERAKLLPVLIEQKTPLS